MGGRLKSTNRFQWGTCNTICDRTGFKVKLSDTRKEWDGYMVLHDVWEPRQPQDFQVTPRPPKTFEESRFRGPDRDTNGNPVQLCPPPFVGKGGL